MKSERLTIQQMSQQTGLSIHTLRYYEQIGLIDPVERADNGHRRYKPTDLTRVDFLKRLRATGMSINEMQYYVNLYREGDETVTERRLILQAHRDVIQAQIDELQDTMALIDTKIARYLDQEQHLHKHNGSTS